MPQTPNPVSCSGLEVLKSFFAISFALVFLMTAVDACHYYTEYRTKRLTTEANEALNVELSRQVVFSDFFAVVSDLQILAQQVEGPATETGRPWHLPQKELGRLERPIKPVMRFATPVFDARGGSRGIVVLNYLGQRLIRDFEQATTNIADHVQLISNHGYWLSSPDPGEQSWVGGGPQGTGLRDPGHLASPSAPDDA